MSGNMTALRVLILKDQPDIRMDLEHAFAPGLQRSDRDANEGPRWADPGQVPRSSTFPSGASISGPTSLREQPFREHPEGLLRLRQHRRGIVAGRDPERRVERGAVQQA